MACSSLSHSLPRSVSTATTQPEPAGRRQSCLDTQCPAVLHNARQVSNRSAQSTVIHTHTHTHTHHTRTHAHPTHTRTYARAHTPHTHTHHTHIHTYIHTRTHHAHTRTHTHTPHTHTHTEQRATEGSWWGSSKVATAVQWLHRCPKETRLKICHDRFQTRSNSIFTLLTHFLRRLGVAFVHLLTSSPAATTS